MLRVEVSERGLGTLPGVCLANDLIVIGSSPAAVIRLPPSVARAEHVRIEGQTWTLLAEAKVGGMVRAAGDSGAIGHAMTIELGGFCVRISAPPAGTEPSPRRRTESLARELARSLLGDGGAPWLEIERGTSAGTRRELAPPESKLIIGRGDEATWVVLDKDLSRAHVEIRRGWDGITVVDLGSKNGTRIDGTKVSSDPVELRDGATLTLGKLVLRFRDPAERHLRGELPESPARPRRRRQATPPPPPQPSIWPVVAYTTIAVLALAAAIWILAS
jgi:FHA domain